MKNQLTLAALCLSLSAIGLIGCTASDEECDALGEHFIKLSIKEAEAQKVPADFVKTVAEEGRKELVGKCKTERPLKSEVDCLMKAESFDDFKKCE
ncbi:hypothetical protein ACNOYE_11630 [Nannocystaceae bacterium ST9]